MLRRAVFALSLLCASAAASAVSFSELYKNYVDAVVVLSYTDGKASGYGTAFHVGGGYFVTAAHVAHNDHLTIEIGDAAYSATVERIYLNDDMKDIAVVRVAMLSRLPSLEFCTSETPVGAPVAVIGYPLAIRPEATLTEGVVASHNFGVVFVSASAAPGNSGGPVIDAARECVVGVLVANSNYGWQRVFTLNFAIPATLGIQILREAQAKRVMALRGKR